MRNTIREIFMVVFGSFLVAFAINAIIIPNHLGEGGITGVNVLLYYLFKFPPAVTNLVINAIIMFIGYRLLDKKTMVYSFISIIALSFFLAILKDFHFVPDNILVAALSAGAILGGGMGIVILGKGTTAGTDIIALILNKYFGISISLALLFIDILIITPLFFVIGAELGVISLIAIITTSRVLNLLIEGLNPKKQIIIISNKYDEIAHSIVTNISRGVTVLDGKGYFSKNKKQVLFIVVNRLQLLPVERIIHDIDPNAFVTISDVQEVIGEGFTFHLEESPILQEE